jgi:hypothetical protein
MADTGIGRILPTEVISPIQSHDRGTGGLHEDVGALRRALSPGCLIVADDVINMFEKLALSRVRPRCD